MERINNFKKTVRAALLLAALAVFPAQAGSPVLLTFDVEKPGDKEKWAELNVSVPATYFILGKFAEKHGDFVAELGRNNSIGSHSYSHDSLKGLSTEQTYLELRLTKELLEKATGRPALWFRAPLLEYGPQTRALLKELGFKYDSAGEEKWTEQKELVELPISGEDGVDRLASDYDIFIKEKLSDEEALSWYKQRFLERRDKGKPLVLLFHPSVIHGHKEVLSRLVAFIQGEGGEFVTADQWAARLEDVSLERVGVWIDPSEGVGAPAQVVADVRSMGVTDVFLMAKDYGGYDVLSWPEKERAGFDALYLALKQSGIKIHAWLPTLFDPKNAQLTPELAMTDGEGRPSVEWLSPSNERTRFLFADVVKALLERYDFDGVHMDYVRYPGLEYDFSDQAVAAFAVASGLKDLKKSDIVPKHYVDWTDWRTRQITEWTKAVHDFLRSEFGHKNIELSAALVAEASVSYQGREKFGQDYGKLSDYLDLIVPMAYFKNEQRPIEWIADVVSTARYRIGDTQLMTGLASYQDPERWKMTGREFRRSVELGAKGSDGVGFFDYSHLFGKGDAAGNMDAKDVAFLPDYLRSGGKQEAETRGRLFNKVPVALPSFGLLAVAAALVLLWTRIRKKNIHGQSPSRERRQKTDFSAAGVDFNALESAIRFRESVSPQTFEETFAVLKGVGPQNISRFRRMRLLEMLTDGPISLIEAQRRLSGPDLGLTGLRRIEEAGMLGYLEIDGDGMVSLSDLGRKLLERGVESGYSAALINFIDARLVEHLVLDCVKCPGKTVGHWFWQHYECSECRHKAEIVRSPRIVLKK
jgi:peptidoglycan/xylan/chitin deacetylase (PgdA/CDA1 family)